MKTLAARDLKNHTGEVLRAVRRGETLLLTFRGRVVGTIAPYAPGADQAPRVRGFDEAWRDIESTMRSTRPPFRTWRQAEDYSRGRR